MDREGTTKERNFLTIGAGRKARLFSSFNLRILFDKLREICIIVCMFTKYERVELETVPYDEECLQVGKASHDELRAEAMKYRNALEKRFAKWLAAEKDLALSVKSCHHDFGTYFEVVAVAPMENDKAVAIAWRMQDELPATWKEAEEEIEPPELEEY